MPNAEWGLAVALAEAGDFEADGERRGERERGVQGVHQN
jgi:hypothetical protein